MARNKNGAFGKVLNFIGLVDDEDPRDTYGEEYQGDNYGRQKNYVPQRNQRSTRPQPQQRQEVARRYPSAYEPTRAPRMNRSTGYENRYEPARGNAPRSSAPARRSNAFVERVDDDRAGRYDYSPRRTTSRFGSVDDNNYADNSNVPVSRFAAESAPQPRRTRGDDRQRTVMFSLHALEDCTDVIDSLILNNTVILTLENLDPRLMQRAVDTLSGAVFALHATIRKASDQTYLIAPATVEVNDIYETDRRF